MIRTLWNGTLELDEIAIPVGLVSVASDQGEGFVTLHAGECGSRVHMRPYCEADEKLLEPEDLVSAWEASPGQYVQVDADAKAALAPVETRQMPIGCFVPVEAIQPELIRKRYRLVPSSPVAARAYFLFTAAIAELQVAGLVRFVYRGEKIGAVQSRDGSLELLNLYFAEDLADRVDLGPLIDQVGRIDGELLALARDLIDRHTRKLRPGDLDSLDRPRVRDLLQRLLASEDLIRPEPVEPVEQNDRPPTGPVELEGALKRSLERAPRRRRTPAATR